MPQPRKPPISPAAQMFGARVLARREDRGWSQERLAAEAGLHWTMIGQVERGRRNLTFHSILKLANALKCDAAELMAGLTYEP